MNMKDNRKYGLLVMSAWLVFAVSLISGYAAYHDVPVLEYFLDEETGGFISVCLFTAWALIWYFVGSHARKEYVARLEVCLRSIRTSIPLLTGLSLGGFSVCHIL